MGARGGMMGVGGAVRGLERVSGGGRSPWEVGAVEEEGTDGGDREDPGTDIGGGALVGWGVGAARAPVPVLG